MANRTFTQFRYSLEKKIVDIYATVDGNGTGAPIVKKFTVPVTGGAGSLATTTAAWKGVVSVARTAQGKWTFTFEDKYVRLVKAVVTFVAIDGVTSPLAQDYFVLSDASATAKTVAVGFTNTAGSATTVDVGTNDRCLFTFTFLDSTP